MKFDLNGKTAVVTGGTKGIGKAIVDVLSSCGCEVITTSRDANICQGNIYQLDLAQQDSINAFIEKIQPLKRIDIFVNNAGVIVPQALWDIDNVELLSTINTNLVGPTILLKEVAQIMLSQKDGRIVNISSIASVIAKNNAAAYSSSKAGIAGLTRAAAIDLAQFGVLVNTVSPGPTNTDMVNRLLCDEEKQKIAASIPLKRLANAAEIARVVLFLCSDFNTYITGQNIVVDGGFTIT
jgi:3-oxoacyl-[acyl-carrier protein] reductase